MTKASTSSPSHSSAQPVPDYPRCSLTGLYFSLGFIEESRQFITRIQPGEYCMVAIDILHFRLFNKLHGRGAGDQLLRHIAHCLEALRKQYGGVTGYYLGDNFAIVMPWKMDLIEQLRYDILTGLGYPGGAGRSSVMNVAPMLGVAPLDDLQLPPEIYYDRATLALSHASVHSCISCYNPDMEDMLEEEMRLLVDAMQALERNEFTFYAQPQCDIFTGKVVGAESLVRWQHSTRGLIPPSRFVPVLERSGMIYLLDQQVWEKVCQWLRSWIDRGYQPVPISINISRIDIMSLDVPEYLIGLLKKYDLPAKYIKTEITESAYAEEDATINSTVERLRQAGFLVMMDDFGSGYSSLNMLKSVPVDVIKIDMRFLEIREDEEQKGIGILESIVNMARLMGLPIIVEGVETLQQENILRNIGCRYTQGYYYYKPLPIDQFETALADEGMLDFTGLHRKQVEAFHMREFMDGNLFTDTMVNVILGPAAIYDVFENHIEITRVNEQAYTLAGLEAVDNKDLSRKVWSNVRDDDRPTLLALFEQAYESRPMCSEGNIHYIRVDGKVLWVHLRVFYLRDKEQHRIYFVSLSDITPLRDRQKNQTAIPSAQMAGQERTQLEQYYGSLPCGFGVSRVVLNDAGDPVNLDVIYVNQAIGKSTGTNLSRLRHMMNKAFGDNAAVLMQKAFQAAYLGETVTHCIYSSLSSHYLQFTFFQHEYGYAACLLRDITPAQLYQKAFRSLAVSCMEVYFLQIFDNYCRMIYPDDSLIMERGNYEAMIERHFRTGRILNYDWENVRRFLSLEHLRKALREEDSVEYRYRRCTREKPDEWCVTTVSVSERENGAPKTAFITIRSDEPNPPQT